MADWVVEVLRVLFFVSRLDAVIIAKDFLFSQSQELPEVRA
jgi:hypothetical protein